MREKDFQRFFNEWIKAHSPKCSIAVELKIEKGGSWAFNKLQDHQAEALYNASNGPGFYHKIADMPRPNKDCIACPKNMNFRFNPRKPFDCFYMKHVESYVVIWFYKKGQRTGNRKMLWIDIADFLAIKNQYENEGRKSLKEEEWTEKATHIFLF